MLNKVNFYLETEYIILNYYIMYRGSRHEKKSNSQRMVQKTLSKFKKNRVKHFPH